MATNPATVYQRRILHAVARLAETVQILRPISGGTQNVTVKPLIVAASPTIIKGVSGSGSGGGAAYPGGTPAPSGGAATGLPALIDPGEIYAGYMAGLLSGDTGLTQPDAVTPNATTQVVPALLLVQDVFQTPAAVGDVFTRDGSSWTVNALGNQLIAGLSVAVLSIALLTP